MTETPKCPYCGAEMMESTERYLDGQYRSRYCCPKCNACAAPGEFCNRAEDAKVSALAAARRRAAACASYQQLIKALCDNVNATPDETLEAAEQLKQRAEPENRPLTLEEVRKKLVSDSIDPPYVWIEQKRDENKWMWIVAAIARLANEKVFNKYNQVWRCWPRKPTPEQMAAEKWEE